MKETQIEHENNFKRLEEKPLLEKWMRSRQKADGDSSCVHVSLNPLGLFPVQPPQVF